MANKVIVESKTSGIVVLDHPAIGVRAWERKGAKKQIDLEALQEAMYDDGVKSIFDSGMLYIEDMDVKKELDLEPVDATEPTNIIVLSDEEIIELIKTAPLAKFKETINKLKADQIAEIARTAIEIKATNLEKSKILKGITGIDVIKTIENEEAAE